MIKQILGTNLVIIEKILTGKFVVSKAQIYSTQVSILKNNKKKFTNIFGEEINQENNYFLNHKTYKIQAGEALSKSYWNETDCLDYIKNNNLTLLNNPIHEGIFSEIDNRLFR